MTSHDLKAFIFDLDGVIINTVGLHYRAWKQLFDDLGIPFTHGDMERFRGIHQRQILLSLMGNLSEVQVTDYLARKDMLYKRSLIEASQDVLYAPTVNLLHEAKAHGLKVGLSSSSISARYALEIVELRHLFDAIADGNTVCRSKPAPDVFVWTAGALGLHPAEIAVIEDGSAGVQGALVAGMFVVGINIDDPAYRPHLNFSMEILNFEAIATHYRDFAHAAPSSVS